MPTLIHKDSDSEHLIKLANLIEFLIRTSGNAGVDQEELVLKISAGKVYSEQEVRQTLQSVIGKGRVKHK
jgi:hypothetical protein